MAPTPPDESGYARFPVVLDANVLIPLSLRDIILRAAALGLCQPYWTEHILAEVKRTFLNELGKSEAQAESIVGWLRRERAQSLVVGYEHLISAMKNHEKDRHVVAAAYVAKAEVIVTCDLGDFRSADMPKGISAQSPDDFLVALFELAPSRFVEGLQKLVGQYSQKRTVWEVVLRLDQNVPLPNFRAALKTVLPG